MDTYMDSNPGSAPTHNSLSPEDIFSLLSATAYADFPVDPNLLDSSSQFDLERMGNTDLLNPTVQFANVPPPPSTGPTGSTGSFGNMFDLHQPMLVDSHPPQSHQQGFMNGLGSLEGLDGNKSQHHGHQQLLDLNGHAQPYACNGNGHAHPDLDGHHAPHLNGHAQLDASAPPQLDGRTGHVGYTKNLNGNPDGDTHQALAVKRKARTYQLDGQHGANGSSGSMNGSTALPILNQSPSYAPHLDGTHSSHLGYGKFSPFQPIPPPGDGQAASAVPTSIPNKQKGKRKALRTNASMPQLDGATLPRSATPQRYESLDGHLDGHLDGQANQIDDQAPVAPDKATRSESMQCLPGTRSATPTQQQQFRQAQHIYHPPHAYYPQQSAFQQLSHGSSMPTRARSNSTSNYHASILAHHAAWIRSRNNGGPKGISHAMTTGYTSMDGHLEQNQTGSDDEGYGSVDGHLDPHTAEGGQPQYSNQSKRPSLLPRGSAPAELNKASPVSSVPSVGTSQGDITSTSKKRLTLQERRKLTRLREARANLRQSLQTRAHADGLQGTPRRQHGPSGSSSESTPAIRHALHQVHRSRHQEYGPHQQSALAHASNLGMMGSDKQETPGQHHAVPSPLQLQPASVQQPIPGPGPLPLQEQGSRAPLPPPPAPGQGWESVVPPRGPTESVPMTAYSSTGFDMLSALLRVASRPKPIINLGPVDLSAAFTVSDTKLPDWPLVYCSDTFLRLTGYERHEVIGRNCRFLQSPDGNMTKGQYRTTTDGAAVAHLAEHLNKMEECQASLINYRKGGQPFLNLVSLIPIPWGTDPEVKYVVGFQVDLAAQPGAVLEPTNGGVAVNCHPPQPMPISHSHSTHDGAYPSVFGPTTVTGPWNAAKAMHLSGGIPNPYQRAQHSQNPRQMANAQAIMRSLYPSSPSSDESGTSIDHGSRNKADWAPIVLENIPDMIYVLSLKGTVLYMSPSVERISGWGPGEMVGRSLGEFIHPADVVPVFRELKDSTSTAAIQAATRAGQAKMNATRAQVQRANDTTRETSTCMADSSAPSEDSNGNRDKHEVPRHRSSNGLNTGKAKDTGGRSTENGRNGSRPAPFGRWSAPTVHLLFRMRSKDTPLHRWVESSGRMHIEQGKGRKVVVSSARPRVIHHVPARVLTAVASSSEAGFWARLSKDTGILLTITPPVVQLLGITAHQMTGQSVKDVTSAEGAAALLTALHAPQTSLVKHTLRDSMGRPVSVLSQLYPSNAPPRPPLDASAPTAQLSEDEHRSVWIQVRRAPVNVALDDDVVYMADSAESQVDTTAPDTGATDEGVFSELDPQRAASWQYELHQLKHQNKRLRQDVQMAYARRRGQGYPRDVPNTTQASPSSRPANMRLAGARTPRLSETAMRDMMYPPTFAKGPEDESPSQSSAGDRNTPVDRLFVGTNADDGSGDGDGDEDGSGSGSGEGNGLNSTGSGSGSAGTQATSLTTAATTPPQSETNNDGRRSMIDAHSSKVMQHSGASLLSSNDDSGSSGAYSSSLAPLSNDPSGGSNTGSSLASAYNSGSGSPTDQEQRLARTGGSGGSGDSGDSGDSG